MLSIKEYLNTFIDLINNDKTQGIWKVHSGNTLIDYKTQGEWKIQMTRSINFIPSKSSGDPLNTKSHNIDIMMTSETYDIIKELSNLFCKISKRFRRKNEKEEICFWQCCFIVL